MHAHRDWYMFSDNKTANAVAACEVVPVLLILVIRSRGIPPRTAKPAAEPHSFFLALRYT
jgi:hypothetical protein